MVTSIGGLVFKVGFYLLKCAAFLENPPPQNPKLGNIKKRGYEHYCHFRRFFILLGQIILYSKLLRSVQTDFFYLEKLPYIFGLESIYFSEKNVQILHQKSPYLVTHNPSRTFLTLFCIGQLKKLRIHLVDSCRQVMGIK